MHHDPTDLVDVDGVEPPQLARLVYSQGDSPVSSTSIAAEGTGIEPGPCGHPGLEPGGTTIVPLPS